MSFLVLPAVKKRKKYDFPAHGGPQIMRTKGLALPFEQSKGESELTREAGVPLGKIQVHVRKGGQMRFILRPILTAENCSPKWGRACSMELAYAESSHIDAQTGRQRIDRKTNIRKSRRRKTRTPNTDRTVTGNPQNTVAAHRRIAPTSFRTVGSFGHILHFPG